MQSAEEIEASYKTPDPWGFSSNPHDAYRKQKIIQACLSQRLIYEHGLEVGAGEGWLTKDLPASVKYGFEISKTARSRMPESVIPLDKVPIGMRFELVVLPGVLYSHYQCDLFFEIMRNNALDVVVTSNIKPWEDRRLSDDSFVSDFLRLCRCYEEEFPYREYTQKLRVFRKL